MFLMFCSFTNYLSMNNRNEIKSVMCAKRKNRHHGGPLSQLSPLPLSKKKVFSQLNSSATNHNAGLYHPLSQLFPLRVSDKNVSNQFLLHLVFHKPLSLQLTLKLTKKQNHQPQKNLGK